MRSMTGHGRGEARLGNLRVVVEVLSVNRRQADIAISLPREATALEPLVREETLSRVSRGRLDVAVSFGRGANGASELDARAAARWASVLRALGRKLRLSGEPSLDLLLRCPGVLAPAAAADPVRAWPTVRKALRRALAALLGMRAREGRRLRADLLRRLAQFEAKLREVAREAPRHAVRHRARILDRLKKTGLPEAERDGRVLREVALMVEKTDLAEEITRLRSHFVEFRRHCRARGAVGRTLDFLCQELAREVNTLAAKSDAADATHRAVAMKDELERIREQVQNVE
ncbi:MAG: YicC family protein [Verrucomicrobiae bacterium]|nr:YicC family protein [Verrucomicrobiae bacterium]